MVQNNKEESITFRATILQTRYAGSCESRVKMHEQSYAYVKKKCVL